MAPYRGAPLLEWVLRAVRGAHLGQRLVVVGHRADEVIAACDVSGFDVVRNIDFAEGQSSSLRTAIKAVDGRAEAAVVALGDQPGITPAVIDALVSAYRRDLRPFAVPTYDGRRGNPVLLARLVFPRLMALDGDVGARAIMGEKPRWVTEVPADDLADPRDVDTPDDLAVLEGARRLKEEP